VEKTDREATKGFESDDEHAETDRKGDGEGWDPEETFEGAEIIVG
jgi:hypothetical protein